MESRLHLIEVEAYAAVLRAFVAQSDVLSWGKEELISDLRKELRVSDDEHREILAKVNADESVKAIRALHQDVQFSPEPITARPIPFKKMKISNAMVHERETKPSSHEKRRYALKTGTESLAVHPPDQISVYLQENPSSLEPDIIEIRATEEVIREVERVCRGENPDPLEVEKAKSLLREHERALVQAIARLAFVEGSDEPTDPQVSTL